MRHETVWIEPLYFDRRGGKLRFYLREVENDEPPAVDVKDPKAPDGLEGGAADQVDE